MITRVLTILMLSLLAVSITAAQEGEIIEYLPAPTGPYQIGSTYRHWIDESRDETLTEDSDDKRELIVRFWYPADVADDAVPMPAIPDAEIKMRLVVRRTPEVSLFANFVGSPSHTYLNAPLAESGTRFPVLVFSPYPEVIPEIYNAQMEELASHGYVIAAPYHTYISPATLFPDGRLAEHVAVKVEVMAEDLMFVMDQLEILDAEDSEGFFTGRLAAESFGLFGMGGGATVADTVCKSDARCAAHVNEVGGPGVSPETVEQLPPALFMSSGRGETQSAYRTWEGPAYNLWFIGFNSLSFSDIPLSLVPGAAKGIATVQAINAYLVAFFDMYLKGEPSPLLDGPSEEYPDVEFESRNTD